MQTPLIIEIASDVICPWCYIGKRRLEKALALLDGEVKPVIRWLPFQLNPDMPASGMPRAEYRKAKFGSLERGRSLDARVAAEGRGEGIDFAFERIERTPDTSAAHQLIDLAQSQGKGREVVDALVPSAFMKSSDRITSPERARCTRRSVTLMQSPKATNCWCAIGPAMPNTASPRCTAAEIAAGRP